MVKEEGKDKDHEEKQKWVDYITILVYFMHFISPTRLLLRVLLLSKLKKFDVFRSYLMFARVFNPLGSLLHKGRWQLFAKLLVNRCFLTYLPDWFTHIMCFSAVWTWIRHHNFKFFLKTRLINLALFELILKRSNIIKRRESSWWNILLASMFEFKIALFPKHFLFFWLLKLIINIF